MFAAALIALAGSSALAQSAQLVDFGTRSLQARSQTDGSAEVERNLAVRAVVVGIDDFAELQPENDLKRAEEDARQFAAVIAALFGAQPQTLLGADATHEAVTAAVEGVLTSATDTEVVVIYFATHGARVGRKSHLLLHDTPTDSQLPFRTVSVDKLRK